MGSRRQDVSGHGARSFLVVDDQPVIRTIARAYLEKAGFVVAEAADGREALERCDGTMPDAILLDREMPNMDGGSFLAALRGRPGGGQPTVILCTASRMPDLAAFAMGVGADALVEKPFDEAGLMLGLRRVGLLGCGPHRVNRPPGGTTFVRRRSHAAMSRRFLGDEGGATAIEYGMIAALIAVAIIGSLKVVGTQLGSMFGAIAAQLN